MALMQNLILYLHMFDIFYRQSACGTLTQLLKKAE